ncbi:MAG: arsenate reductase family protein [Clostridia bacterium]|nr:arsenate reductase family protein [Clostridia bacterium]
MNIQIFGTGKCFDTKKAQRFFKERGIRFQMIDLREKGFSRGELRAVLTAVGGLDALVDKENKNYCDIKYLLPDAIEEKLLLDPSYIRTPVVRNGKQATVGYSPDIWKTWE